jgi:hypothetical protein
MLHYIELMASGNDSGFSGNQLLALAPSPIPNGNIVGVEVLRAFATAFGGDIQYDIRIGPNPSSLVTIFANPAHRPNMPFGSIGPVYANTDAFPVAVTNGQWIGFYRQNSNSGGGGNRPVGIIIIDDGILNETEMAVITGSLADLAEANITAPLGKSFVLTAVETDVEARVTAYRSPAYRTADAARPIGELPTGDHGVIVDVNNVTPGKLNLSPIMYGATAEIPRSGDIAIRVQNRSGGATPVEVTFTLNKLEA